MKKILYILSVIAIAACTSTDTSQKEIIKEQTEVIIAKKDIKADAKVKIEIEGMTCEMGCVSTIRNHITQMKGVTKFEMDFTTERKTDFATVEFDSRLLSSDDMVTEIESIAQGIYKVVKVVELEIN